MLKSYLLYDSSVFSAWVRSVLKRCYRCSIYRPFQKILSIEMIFSNTACNVTCNVLFSISSVKRGFSFAQKVTCSL
jgi:hypothetical protein